MKRIIFFIASVFLVATSLAQTKRPQALGGLNIRLVVQDQIFVDSMFRVSKRNDTTVNVNARDSGILYYVRADKHLWYYDGVQMQKIPNFTEGGGGGGTPGGANLHVQYNNLGGF